MPLRIKIVVIKRDRKERSKRPVIITAINYNAPLLSAKVKAIKIRNIVTSIVIMLITIRRKLLSTTIMPMTAIIAMATRETMCKIKTTTKHIEINKKHNHRLHHL